MNGGIVHGDEADEEDLERDRAGQLRQQRGAGVDADDARRTPRDRGPRGCCAPRSACCRRSAAATRPTTRSRPRAAGRRRCRGRPWRRRRGTGSGRSGSRGSCRPTGSAGPSRCLGARSGRHARRRLLDRRLQADDGQHVHALQLGVEADRERHAAALDVTAAATWPANSALRNSLSSLPRPLLVGHQDLGLVERDVERLRRRPLRVRSGPSSRSALRAGRRER